MLINLHISAESKPSGPVWRPVPTGYLQTVQSTANAKSQISPHSSVWDGSSKGEWMSRASELDRMNPVCFSIPVDSSSYLARFRIPGFSPHHTNEPVPRRSRYLRTTPKSETDGRNAPVTDHAIRYREMGIA